MTIPPINRLSYTAAPSLPRDTVKMLEQAIHDRQVVTFFYKDDVRTVVPVALGEKTAGDYKLRAYQVYPVAPGEEGMKQWRLFDVVKIGVATFQGLPGGYVRGDKDMRHSLVAQL